MATINGTAFNDRLTDYRYQNDTLTGGGGDDWFLLGGGYYTITDLGNGNDQVYVSYAGHVTATLVADWNPKDDWTYNLGEATVKTAGHNIDMSGSMTHDDTFINYHGWNITNSGSSVGVKMVGTRAETVRYESKTIPRHGLDVIHHAGWAGGRHSWASHFRQISVPD